MLSNNIKNDIKEIFKKEKITQLELSKKIGVSNQYISNVLSKDTLVSKALLQFLDELGYDIKIEYIKK